MKGRYRYSLDQRSTKFICPECLEKRFVRYIDNDTQQYLPEQYGKCDRSDHYHLNPYKDGYAKSIGKHEGYNSRAFTRSQLSKAEPPKAFIPLDVLRQTTKDHTGNNFFNNLLQNVKFPFSPEDLDKVIELYLLGTIIPLNRRDEYLRGAITFPYFESIDKIQAIQIVQYDKANHRKFINWIDNVISPGRTIDVPLEFPAVKGKVDPIEWVEARRDQRKVNCFFGAHLVKMFPHNPIILVEGPKSAIIGMLYFGSPDDDVRNPIWLATGSRDTFSLDRAEILKGREVWIFPDLSSDGNTHKLWSKRAKEYQANLKWSSFYVSSYFEENASYAEKQGGLDIADYLIKKDWRVFRNRNTETFVSAATDKIIEPITPNPVIVKPRNVDDLLWDKIQIDPIDIEFLINRKPKLSLPKNEDWSKEIEELDSFFNKLQLPAEPIQLYPYLRITNILGFLSANLEVARAQNGNPTYRPYLNRVIELMNHLKENK